MTAIAVGFFLSVLLCFNVDPVTSQGSSVLSGFGEIFNPLNFANLYFGGRSTTRRSKSPYASPCPTKFNYFYNGREWKGRIFAEKVDPNNYENTEIKADFFIPEDLQNSNQLGRLDPVPKGNSIQEDLQQGLPLLFEVAFATQNPVPRLAALYRNQQEICGIARTETPAGFVRIRYSYIVKGLYGSGFQAQTVTAPQRTYNNYDYNNYTPRPNVFQSDGAVCGIPFGNLVQSLVVGGEKTNHGEWPWLVAFYRSFGGNLEFICGASLVSEAYSLTAAHCIQDKGKNYPLESRNVLLFFGKYNLVQWNEEGFEKRGARQFILHPDWNTADAKYDADIALINMDAKVKFSKLIRPICLWNGPNDINSLVGTKGTVVGWGKNENRVLNTNYPKKVQIPIVHNSQCLRSHDAFLYITSQRTFCAGGRYGEGPCQGGGLVLKSGNRWFLRGIVAAALRDGDSCDVNNYIVFTDVAKFIPWIQSNIVV